MIIYTLVIKLFLLIACLLSPFERQQEGNTKWIKREYINGKWLRIEPKGVVYTQYAPDAKKCFTYIIITDSTLQDKIVCYDKKGNVVADVDNILGDDQFVFKENTLHVDLYPKPIKIASTITSITDSTMRITTQGFGKIIEVEYKKIH